MAHVHLNYHDQGQGHPLILIHGLSDDLHFWDPLIPCLSPHYRIISLGLRGHGQSGKTPGPYSIKLFSEDIFHLLNKLGIDKAHFMGFSMGGAIAQQFVLDHTEMVSSMILMSVFSYVDADFDEKLIKLREYLLEGGFGLYFDKIIPMVLTPKVIHENRTVLEDLKAEKIKNASVEALVSSIDAIREFNIKDRLSNIKKPTLIIAGQEDVLISVALQRETHNLIEGSKFDLLADTGHNILIPDNMDYLAELILKFLG
jgi:3-oxoadipate enol-lactonase